MGYEAGKELKQKINKNWEFTFLTLPVLWGIGRDFFLVLLDEYSSTNLDEIYIQRFSGKWSRKQQNLNAVFALLECFVCYLFVFSIIQQRLRKENLSATYGSKFWIYLPSFFFVLSGYLGRTGNGEGNVERYILLGAKLGICSCCSKQGRNQNPWDCAILESGALMDGVLHGLSPSWMTVLCISKITVQLTQINCVHSCYLSILTPWFSTSISCS